jgi:hypothetical protein
MPPLRGAPVDDERHASYRWHWLADECNISAMVALRSRRLERLFGARLEHVTHAQVADFVINAVVEAYDLDFKGELYARCCICCERARARRLSP